MITIDARSSKPIFLQIVDNVKESILKGAIAPGDKMPSVREMAVSLETNPNTVAKAYKELERQKIIETIQGRGTFVSRDYVFQINDEQLSHVKRTLKKAIVESKYMGMDKSKLMKIVEEIFDELGGGDGD